MSRSAGPIRGGRGARAALRPLLPLAAALALTLAAAVPGVAAESKAPAAAPWTLAFQISDLHFCAWGDEPWYASSFGDREGDAQLLADASTGLVRWLAPDVVLVTGDLTDGKQLGGTGTQQPSEWASYARFLRTLAGALPGVPLLDVRGNHDSFDVPYRGAPSDGYAGSTGADFPTARVPVGALSGSRAGRAVGPGEPQCRATLARVAATALPPAQRGAWKRLGEADPLAAQAATAAAKAGCPSLVLLGVDVAPEPGLRSPANFAGRANETLLAEVRDALGRARPGDACTATPVLAYGHYPLSTVARHEAAELDPLVARDAAAGADAPTSSWASELARLAGSPLAALSAPWRGGARVARAAMQSWRSTDGLLTELAAGGSDLYVSGHLHAAFGEALHAVHEVDVGRNGSRSPSSSSSSPSSPIRRLVELEATSWKEDRRVRWLVADAASGAVSFVDAHFVPAPNASGSAPGADPPFPAAGVPLTRRVGRRAEALADDPAWVAARELRGWGLAPASSPPGVWDSAARNLEHAARHVHATLAVVHPPDARYAPSARGGAAVTPARGAVRVASWTLPQAPAGTAEAVALDAYWYPSGELALENVATTVAAAAASADGAGVRRLHEAVLGVSRSDKDARGALGLAIRARAAREDHVAGAIEDAATAPVLVALECDDADCYVAAPGAAAEAFSPAPATTLLERFTLFVNWPVFAQRLFYLIWFGVVSALLLAPKLAVRVAWRRGASRLGAPGAPGAPGQEARGVGRAPAAEQVAGAADAPAQQPPCPRPASGCRVSRPSSLCAVGAAALFPWRAAVAYASLPVRWALTVAWWVGLLLGPWTMAAAMTGAPYSLVFHAGEVGVLPGPSVRLADAGPGTPTPAFLLRFVPTQDTLFLALIELCAAHAPLLVWVQWVVAYRRQGALGPRWADCGAGKAANADAAASAREGWDEDRRPLLASPSGRDLGAPAPGADAPAAPRALRRLLGRLSSALPRPPGARVASPCVSPSRLLGASALTFGYLAILVVNYLVMYRRLTPFLGKAAFASPGIVGAPFLALAFALVGPVVAGGSRRGAAPVQPHAAPEPAASSVAQAGASARSPEGKAD